MTTKTWGISTFRILIAVIVSQLNKKRCFLYIAGSISVASKNPIMKNTILILIFLTLFFSCKKESKKTQEPSKKEKGIMYTRNLDCESFYQSIDFSSLCFTSEKTPKIQPTQNHSGNNCQYKILLEEYGTEIYVLVNYTDYEKSMFDDPEMAREIHEQTFQKSRNRSYLFTKTTDINMEDAAYFGYHEEHKQKSIHIRMGNVVIAIQVEGIDKTNPCVLSNDELTKFASLIINQVKR